MSRDDDCIRVSVPGKINLALKVGGVDDDGYHPLATVFQAVSLFDDVTVKPAEDITVTVAGRPSARLVQAEDRRWRSWGDIAALFDGPEDEEWARDRDEISQQIRDPWAEE